MIHTMFAKCRSIVLLTLISAVSTTMVSNSNDTCPQHLYNVHIFSTNPLIIYIPKFITESEAAHLRSISANEFTSSQIADSSGQQQLASTRTSRSTSLKSDGVVRCIEERALMFQGLRMTRENLEPLQLVEYGKGQKYHAHTDWFTSPLQTTPEYGGNRLSSFFVYVHASDDIIGGGTQFPLLDAPDGEAWCEYVNCDAAWEDGVVFRPVAGNAVFWRNLKSVKVDSGKKTYVGDRRTLHAGLPVQRGSKLGMNIWTRERELNEKYRTDGA
ncbi:hypothetical protein BKA66DRAFT_450879 [Pyrenochaeta sp. MPI-SDFR-AT-0127]|nr:hypothetical protein BKA66DRAFT_450879 [Pyrenochaeta sp. MPI-SDFR-AT-0127]